MGRYATSVGGIHCLEDLVMNNKVKKRKHRHRYDQTRFILNYKMQDFCKCGKVRPLNNKVEG